jgi:tRNA(Ile)-lysidine synthase
VIESVRKYIADKNLLRPGERVAVAVSGGADSVALLRVLLQLQEELGVVLSISHFHHGIRGHEADADQQFVAELAECFDLEFHSSKGDAPAHAREHGQSLETAARELRHSWFAELIRRGKADKVATAHTQNDQAETVLMRIIRGAGSGGLAGISPLHHQKGLVRPFLTINRAEIEEYLRGLRQPWREDLTNKELAHTRNRVRSILLPLLERDFNPAIQHTLGDLAEVAQAEAEYWEREVAVLIPRVFKHGKPSRSGRSTTGGGAETWSLDLAILRGVPLALQRHLLHRLGADLGTAFEFKHIEELTRVIAEPKPAKPIALPNGFSARCTFRELQFSRAAAAGPQEAYCMMLKVPGEVTIAVLGSTLRARVISAGDPAISGYNPALLLDRALLQTELIVRNWRAGDRYFPAHTQAPKKVKELLQTGRLGRALATFDRQMWPVIESAGDIVWMRGFSVPAAFARRSGDAVLIEEVETTSGTNSEP